MNKVDILVGTCIFLLTVLIGSEHIYYSQKWQEENSAVMNRACEARGLTWAPRYQACMGDDGILYEVRIEYKK